MTMFEYSFPPLADAGVGGFDAGDALIEHRFELVVGEDVERVLFYPLTHQLADIERIKPARDAALDHLEQRLSRLVERRGLHRPDMRLLQPARGLHDAGADETRAQDRDADAGERQLRPR